MIFSEIFRRWHLLKSVTQLVFVQLAVELLQVFECVALVVNELVTFLLANVITVLSPKNNSVNE